jgi:flavin-dependent dehydrogenase
VAADADVIVVGARCAGASTAIALARAGRSVIAVDRARFPADTLSTHLLFAGGVAELQALGALERVEAVGAPRLPVATMTAGGMTVRAGYTPVDGIDYGMCVRRSGLDAALVDTARAAGADVREQTWVTRVLWDGRRAAGVRVRDADGHEQDLRAPLIVGADGRRSLVAHQAGAVEAPRSSANERACYFVYYEDRPDGPRDIASQWREGRELGTAFPCDGGLVLVLLMPPVERVEEFRADLQGAFAATVERLPGLVSRLEGCEPASKVRQAVDTTSYFRRSAGPGWALPGDAGHFKDPVTAQGIRDALRYGRLLGEAAAPALDSPRSLDRALRKWARRRERECLEVYQWTNLVGRGEAVSPIEAELYRAASRDPELAGRLIDVFSRVRRPGEVLTARLFARLALRARPRRAAARRFASDFRTALRDAAARSALALASRRP